MTGELLDRGAQVTAFEIDSGFARVLGRLLGSRAGFTLVKGDALATWRGAGSARFLLGNLPYTIGARLLGLFIQEQRFFTRMVVMVQREVAARMTACAGSKDYASFSVLCASAYTVTPLIRLKGASFYPVPQVESQALRLDLKGGAACYPPAFYPLVRRLFLSRRKTLKNNLQCLLDSGIIKDTQGKDAGAALERCGIDGNRRPETLCLDEFTALARELEEESWG
jgi:16S rRNA (adenine1518-N6/adenine1519-N6)-dimethyltransferase